MSEPENGNTPPVRRPVAVMTIEMFADESIVVNGPITNLTVSYGMLGRAHDAIKDYNDNLKKSGLITLPPGSQLKT